MNTSAHLAIGLSRKGTLPRILRSAGAALTVIITATIDRGLTTRLDDSPDISGHVTSTQTPPSAPLSDRLCVSRDVWSDTDIIAQTRRTGVDRPRFFTLSLPERVPGAVAAGWKAPAKPRQQRIKR